MESMEHHIKFILSISNMFYTLIYHQSKESMTEQELGNLSVTLQRSTHIDCCFIQHSKHCNQPSCLSAGEWIMKIGRAYKRTPPISKV